MTAELLDVPPGAIAAVVTYLEMTERPRPKPMPLMAGLQLAPVTDPDLEWYRTLFRAIGGPWLWFSRLRLDDDALRARLTAPGVVLYVVRDRRRDVGLLELDCGVEGEVEISFFGVIPELTGKGVGSWLMAQALALAWARKPRRVWLHTCTLDHPKALPFYLKQGFKAYDRKVEIASDPRLLGILPRDIAPHIPLIGEA